MSVGAKLAAFAAILAASFGVGAVVGAAIGPIDVDGDSPVEHQDMHEDSVPDVDSEDGTGSGWHTDGEHDVGWQRNSGEEP